MNLDRARWRWSILAAFAVIAAFLLLAASERGWDVIGLFHIRPFFADLAAILAAGDAQRAGLDVYHPNPFDPFNRPHVYGPWWLVTAHLGLVMRDAWWLGAVLGLAFIGAVLWLLAPRNWQGAVLALALLLSPPVLLGVERGNNDLVIFLLLVVAAAWLARPAAWAGLAASGLLVLAAVLKFYPLAALAGLLTRRERTPRIIIMVGCSVALFSVLWWQQREDFFRALALAPRPDTFLAYGVRLIAVTWSRGADLKIWLVLGYLLGGGLSGVLLWRGRAALARLVPAGGVASTAAVLGASCWLFCYFANNNYPYRAVLLLLLVPAWLQLARDAAPEARALGRGSCALLLATLWLATPRWWVMEWLRTAEPGASNALRGLLTLIGAEQVMVGCLSGIMLYGLVAWAWRRAQELRVRD